MSWFSLIEVLSLPHYFIFGSDSCKRFKISTDFNDFTWECKVKLLKGISYKINLDELVSDCGEEMSPSEKLQVQKILYSYHFISNEERLGRTDKMTIYIDTGNAKPLKQQTVSHVSLYAWHI